MFPNQLGHIKGDILWRDQDTRLLTKPGVLTIHALHFADPHLVGSLPQTKDCLVSLLQTPSIQVSQHYTDPPCWQLSPNHPATQPVVHCPVSLLQAPSIQVSQHYTDPPCWQLSPNHPATQPVVHCPVSLLQAPSIQVSQHYTDPPCWQLSPNHPATQPVVHCPVSLLQAPSIQVSQNFEQSGPNVPEGQTGIERAFLDVWFIRVWFLCSFCLVTQGNKTLVSERVPSKMTYSVFYYGEPSISYKVCYWRTSGPKKVCKICGRVRPQAEPPTHFTNLLWVRSTSVVTDLITNLSRRQPLFSR